MSYDDERTEFAVRLDVEISTRTTVYRYSLRILRVQECTYFRFHLSNHHDSTNSEHCQTQIKRDNPPRSDPGRGLGKDENVIARKYTDEIAIEGVRGMSGSVTTTGTTELRTVPMKLMYRHRRSGSRRRRSQRRAAANDATSLTKSARGFACRRRHHGFSAGLHNVILLCRTETTYPTANKKRVSTCRVYEASSLT